MNGKAAAKSRIPQVRSKLPSSRLPSSQIPSSKSKTLRQNRGDTIVSNHLRDSGPPAAAGLRKPSENKDNRSNRYEEASLSRSNQASSSVKAKQLKPSSNFKGLGATQVSGLAPYGSAKSLSKSSCEIRDNISISSSDDVPPSLNTRKFTSTASTNKSDQLRKVRHDSATEMSSPSVVNRTNVDPDILAFERFKESVPRSGTSHSLYSSSEKSFGGSQELNTSTSKQTTKKTTTNDLNNKLPTRSLPSKSRLNRKQPAPATDGKTFQHKSRLPDEMVTSSVNTLNYVKKLNSNHEANKRNIDPTRSDDSPSPNDFVPLPKATIHQSKTSSTIGGKLGSKRGGPLGSRWANDSEQSRPPSKHSTVSNINKTTLRSRPNEQGLHRKKYQSSLKPKDNGRQFLKITEVPDEFLDDDDDLPTTHFNLPHSSNISSSEQYFDGRNNQTVPPRQQRTNHRIQPSAISRKKKPATVVVAANSLAAQTNIARIARPVLRPQQQQQKNADGNGENDRLQGAVYLSTSSSHTDSLIDDTTSQHSIDEPAIDEKHPTSLEMDTNHNPANFPPNTETFDNNHHQQTGGNLTPEEEERLMERKRQNERYMDILQNQDMLNFGHWRMRQEGNYSPEEKYGLSERRVIRTTSIGSSHASSCDDSNKITTKLATDKLIASSNEHVDVDQVDCEQDDDNLYLSGFRTSLSKSKTKEAEIDEVHHDGLKDVTLESLPSVGSTTLMADFGETLLEADETEESATTDTCRRKHENNNAINDLLKGGYGEILNRCKEESPIGRGGRGDEKFTTPTIARCKPLPTTRTYSNRTKASTTTIHDNSNGDIDDLKLDGRSLLDEAVVEESGSQTQHSCKELTSNLDDMQSDVQIFKQALIQMQSCLEQEEEEKEKVQLKCRDLELERDQLKEEISKLKQVILKKEEEEVLRQEVIPEKPESREVSTSATPTPVDTSDSGSQTEDFEQKKIDNMKLNLEMASQYINKLKNARVKYDETMQQTEEAIHGVLLDLNQTSS